MANLTENTQNPVWSTGIYQIETSDPVLGGANGIANRQAKELAARTQWLKTELARAVALIGTNQQTSTQQFALKTTSLTAGAGLTGGGVLRDNMTVSLGTPSKITATTTNSAVSNTHTHEIDKASTTIAGIVKLNNTLTSTAINEALTAAQGKVLAEQIVSAVSSSLNLRGHLGSHNLNDLKGTANFGIWYQPANVGATTALNYPTTAAGTLWVLPSAYLGVQWYFPFSSQTLYVRYTGDGGVWSAWREMGVDWANIRNNPLTIKAQANTVDANTLKTDGVYSFGSGGINLPTTSGAYHIIVIAGANPAWCCQTAYKAYSNERYVRTLTTANGSWGAWVRDDGVDWESVRNKPNLNQAQDMRSNIPNLTPTVAFQDATPTQLPLGIYEGLSGKANLNGSGNGIMRIVKAWNDRTGTFAMYREGHLPNGEIWRQYAKSDMTGWQERIPIDGLDKVSKTAAETITGEKTFNYQIKLNNTVSGGNYSARFGVNNRDTFIHNQTSNKFLQLDNDGSLKYDSQKVFYEGNLPTWAQVSNKPNTFDGYGLSGEKTYNGRLIIAGGSYPNISLSPNGSQNNWIWEASGENAMFIHRNRTSSANVKVINLPNQAGTLALESSVAGKVSLTGDETISGNKTFSGNLNVQNGITAAGIIKTSYNHDWIGFIANQPTEGKHIYFDGYVRDICRGSYQIVSEGGGRYAAKIAVTPAGATNTDRRVVGMTITEGAVHTNGYGWLHEYFAKQADFANSRTQNGYQKLPNGLIFQWMEIRRNIGAIGGDYTFPIAFPHACYGVCMGNHQTDNHVANGYVLRAKVLSTTQFRVQEDMFYDRGRGNAAVAFVFAIGH